MKGNRDSSGCSQMHSYLEKVSAVRQTLKAAFTPQVMESESSKAILPCSC
jgi:hypothetical protein